MLKLRVIKKIYDVNRKLWGYTIQDESGALMDVDKAQLKSAVFTNQVEIVNMTMTSDGRLIGRASKQPKKVDNKSGEILLQVFTNGRNIVAAMIDQSELAKGNWELPKITGLDLGRTFDVGHEAMDKVNKGLYDNVKIIDGKPDLTSVKRRSFKNIRKTMLSSIVNDYKLLTDITFSVSKGNKKYEYAITIDQYDDILKSKSNAQPTLQMIYCLIEDTMVTNKLKVLYIDEDRVYVQSLTGINDVRKAVKQILSV